MGLFKKPKTDLTKNIFEGASIQQALTNAAEALNVSTDQISYDVISYGSTGVFGLVGNKRAKIRVKSSMRVKEKAMSATEKYWREIQEEQNNFASKELHKEKRKPEKSFKETKEAKPETQVNSKNKAKTNNKKQVKQVENGLLKTPENSLATQAAAETHETYEKPRRNRSRNRRRSPKNNDYVENTFVNDTEMPDMEAVPQEPLTGQLLQAQEVLHNLTEQLLDGPFQVIYTLSEKKISFIIKGNNLSALIGKNGSIRRSLQLVTDRIINKGGQGKYDVNLVVDTERQNKSKRMLATLAKKKADLCRNTHQEISLGFMNAYERCVIHIALKKDPDVETKSVGEGAKKELFIIPINKTAKNKNSVPEVNETEIEV